jgi:2-polyprenyl-3-methyl-5-hydroxy-6-metoxy-1,4-benzoquinol methylase
MEVRTHWNKIYQTKPDTQVSWYQESPLLSLQFIYRTEVSRIGQIIDVGGGASTLVDHLLADGFQSITVLDISAAALRLAQQRLGERANTVTWLEEDITQVALPHHHYDIWHDRAVFHFLTQPEDRQRYVETVRDAIKPGGHVIIATFGIDGPSHCSGLEVARYNADGLHNVFGVDFKLLESTREEHQTPFGTQQKFIYCYCRKGGFEIAG